MIRGDKGEGDDEVARTGVEVASGALKLRMVGWVVGEAIAEWAALGSGLQEGAPGDESRWGWVTDWSLILLKRGHACFLASTSRGAEGVVTGQPGLARAIRAHGERGGLLPRGERATLESNGTKVPWAREPQELELGGEVVVVVVGRAVKARYRRHGVGFQKRVMRIAAWLPAPCLAQADYEIAWYAGWNMNEYVGIGRSGLRCGRCRDMRG